MTKKMIVLMGFIGIIAYAVYAQQPAESRAGQLPEQQLPAKEKPAPVSEKLGEQKSPNNLQKPKYGIMKAHGSPLSFMNKGEGTLQFEGQGVVLISDLNGSLQVQGFKELKQLPKGVTIKPSMAKRLRLFQGQGSITIKGKYGSVRVKLKRGQMKFVGSGSLNIDGKGKYVYEGKEGDLINIGTMTFFVPTPDWIKQQLKEAEQLIAPKGRSGETK